MDMGLLKKWFKWSELVLAMLMVQIFVTGMQLLSKVILSEGTFIFALMAYRHIVAAICIAPFAFLFERITSAMGLFYYGLRDTTPTYATDFLNLIPIATFVLSIITRIEKLNLQTRAGQARSFGVIACVGGAITASLYKGKAFHMRQHSHHSRITVSVNTTYAHWTRGTIMLAGSCLFCSTWFIVQGVLATAATFCLISWAISVQGPLYPPMFNPFSLIFVALLSALILGEEIRIGNLLGMILIICGLYSFLWGKRKEMKSPDLPKSEAPELQKQMVSCPQPQGHN